MIQLVVVCSGSTEEAKKETVVGWRDLPLSDEGRQEARQAGRILRAHGLTFDLSYTSVLKRAIETLWEILRETDLQWVKVNKSWRLNGRHYGMLEGMSFDEIAGQFGEQKLHNWLTGYDVQVPRVAEDDPRHPSHDPRYQDLIPEEIPSGETLLETFSRIYPHWDNKIAPMVKIGRRVLIVAHQNSIRGIMTMLEGLTPEDVFDLEIPQGMPIVYTLDDDMTCIRKEVLEP